MYGCLAHQEKLSCTPVWAMQWATYEAKCAPQNPLKALAAYVKGLNLGQCQDCRSILIASMNTLP